MYGTEGFPEKLDSYVSDYKVNLFEVAWLTDEQVEMFQSDFKVVADYFVQKRKNNDYTPTNTEIKHVEAVLQLLSIMEHDDRFAEAIYSEDGRKAKNMCDVLDAAEQRGVERGEKNLGMVIKRLLGGEDKETLRRSGVNEKTLNWAVEVLGM